jgi:hypothetical protein
LEGDSWNNALVDRIAETFLKGIERLKKMEALKFRLIEYIPVPSDFSHNAYCQQIVNRIISSLKEMDILWSRRGEWISPVHAFMTPPEFIADRTPLFDDDDINLVLRSYPLRKFISDEYTQNSLLQILGCISLNWHNVRQMIQRRDFPFSEKSNECLAKLFGYLSRSISGDKDHLLQLKFLKSRKVDESIVWLSRTDHVVFPDTIKVPDYIDLTTLDPDFTAAILRDENAKYFLTARLGITEISYGYIVTQIIKAHNDIARGNLQDCAQILMHHAQYLAEIGFRTNLEWNPFQQFQFKLKSGFRFLDHKDDHDIAANVVQDTEFDIGGGRKCRLSQANSPRIRLLNSRYAPMIKFLSFFDIPRFPPLATGDRLSDFYKDLAPITQGDNRLLYLLIEHELWGTLSLSTKNKLYSELRLLDAKCENGTLQALESCYLRSHKLAQFLVPGMNILDLADPDHAKWESLKNFGVMLLPDAKYYLEKLRQLKSSQSVSDIPTFKAEVTKTYSALLNFYAAEDQMLIRFDLFYCD